MENINKLRTLWIDEPHARLSNWREFRLQNKDLDLHTLCELTAQWWSAAPICSISIDPYDPSSWPDVWQLLTDGDVCKYSVSLGMAYTIYYAKSNENIVIVRFFDEDKDDIYNATLINNQLLLGHTPGKVVDFKSVAPTLKIQEQWPIYTVINLIKDNTQRGKEYE